MITKNEEQQITILNDGQLQVKTITVILEDGVEISRSNHRHVVDVGNDVANETQMVKDAATAFHTAARISARANAKAAGRDNGVN